MRLTALLFLPLMAASGPQTRSPLPSAYRAWDAGDWVRFYGLQFDGRRLDYYYDRSTVRRTGDIVAARWQVLGSPEPTVTLYRIEIACRAGRFTERGTVLIDADGRSRDVPPSELLVDRPIEAGTSSDMFRSRFCE